MAPGGRIFGRAGKILETHCSSHQACPHCCCSFSVLPSIGCYEYMLGQWELSTSYSSGFLFLHDACCCSAYTATARHNDCHFHRCIANTGLQRMRRCQLNQIENQRARRQATADLGANCSCQLTNASKLSTAPTATRMNRHTTQTRVFDPHGNETRFALHVSLRAQQNPSLHKR